MEIPLLYRHMETQLRQWVLPKDKHHLQGYAEAIAAILQSASDGLSHWLPYMSHCDCKARTHMERLSYLVHNQHITTERFYHPLLEQVFQSFAGEALTLTVQGRVFSAQYLLTQIATPVGAAIAGPLADHVFEPAMQPTAPLARLLGGVFSTGLGAGMAVQMTVFSFFGAVIALAGYGVRQVRELETKS